MSNLTVLHPTSPAEPALVVFGCDGTGKPRASWFDANSAELAIKAASLMNMQVLKLATEEQKVLARQLAPGRVFASGRAFTPFARNAVFGKLVELAHGANGQASGAPSGGEQASASTLNGHAAALAGSGAASSSAVPAAPPRPETCDGIGIGSLVLATTGVEDGWWESVVLGINGEALTLRWRAFPREPTFVRRRTELALLPPTAH
jgi:hypothetical protein